MNHAKSSLAKTEIIKQLGYFPAFLLPAIDSSLIYDSLVQQTLFAYINNPLPIQFREKLFILLSRHFGISYFTICHSCSLRSQGVSAREILNLEKFQHPQSELEIAEDLEILQKNWQPVVRWQNNSAVENSLLRCASLIFIQPQHTSHLTKALKELLGTFNYHYLIVFLGYIKLCHQWLQSNSQIKHEQDRRSQLYLGSLLLEEIQLARFFQSDSSPQVQTLVAQVQSRASAERLVAVGKNTKFKTALPQLRQKTLAACLANAPFPVMIHNKQGQIIHLNHDWLDASGYDAEELLTLDEWQQKALVEQREIVKLPQDNFNQLYNKYVAPAHETALEATNTLQQIVNSLTEITPKVVQSKIRDRQRYSPAVRSELTVATKTGEQLYWELYSTPLNFEDEADELIVSIAKDITDIVHHENKLAETEAKLRLVLEATKTGNWSQNLVTNRVEICHRGRSILGLKNFDGSYQSFLQSIESKERKSIDMAIAKAVKTRQDLDIQYSAINSEQKVCRIQTKAKLDYDAQGQPIGLTGVVMDITPSGDRQNFSQSNCTVSTMDTATNFPVSQVDRPQTSSELKAIIDLLPYYLFVLDLKTQTISLVNSGLLDSFALVREEVVGNTIAACFSGKYAQQIAWVHHQAKIYRKAIHVQEEVNLADGVHHFDTVVTPLYDRSGNISALLHTSSDIPDLAATQEALSQRTVQLEAANRELESFSYSVSHDLQAPLRVINGFSQVLSEKYQLELDERGQHYLQRIQANSQRMSDLIDALLQLSRVTRSQMNSVNVNLSAIAEDVIEELQNGNPQRQIKLKITPDLNAIGDPQLLRIVLSNLLHNAWKYTSKKSDASIEFGMITDDVAQSTYFVRDNGAGFDPEYADKLFTAFQRLHNQSEFPGTGIGLATVQRVIYRHGGKVWANGECDRGATIYFSL